MRAVLLSLAGLVLAGNAYAADLLRGAVVEPGPRRGPYNWAGIYGGGQWGYGNADFDFTASVRPLIAHVLRETTLEEEGRVSEWSSLPKRDVRGNSYGGFVGYNSQWGDAVVGVELNYNRTSLSAHGTDSIGRITSLSNGVNSVLLTSAASATLTDYGTLRFRGGYAWNWLMPYAMIGFAVGQANVTRAM